jgi:hypothetical protein
MSRLRGIGGRWRMKSIGRRDEGLGGEGMSIRLAFGS